MDAINGRPQRRASSTGLFDEDRSTWGFVTRRLLVGVGLVAVGLIWSILNSTVWAPRSVSRPSIVRHGSLETSVQTLDHMRVRPQLVTADFSANTVDVRVTFHNDAAAARPVAPRDVYLLAGGRMLAPVASVATPLRSTVLVQGAYVTGTLRFAHALMPGVTIVYAPSWDGGRALRWRLYQ